MAENFNVIYFIAISFFLVLIKSFNINSTTSNFFVCEEAKTLLGTPTSNYPKEAFFNSLLYGHSDVNFRYYDFLTTYQSKKSYAQCGYLVVGNDAKLGGIYLDDCDCIALPIPGSTITKVYSSQFAKYFPNGYSILYTRNSEVFYGYGKENSTYNGKKVCSDCYAGFFFSDDEENPFQPNIFWGKDILPNEEAIDITTSGYLKSYDDKSGKGLIKITFYETIYKGKAEFDFVNDKYLNEINISFADHENVTYKGTLMMSLENSTSYYNFTGWWYTNY